MDSPNLPLYILSAAVVLHAFATGLVNAVAARALYLNVRRAIVDAANEVRTWKGGEP